MRTNSKKWKKIDTNWPCSCNLCYDFVRKLKKILNQKQIIIHTFYQIMAFKAIEFAFCIFWYFSLIDSLITCPFVGISRQEQKLQIALTWILKNDEFIFKIAVTILIEFVFKKKMSLNLKWKKRRGRVTNNRNTQKLKQTSK